MESHGSESATATGAHESPASGGGGSPTTGGHGAHSSDRWANNPWRGYQLHQRHDYPLQVWMFIGAGIGFLILSNIIYILRSRARKNALFKALRKPQAAEPVASPSNNKRSWRRLPLSIEAAWKIVAFRCTIPYGLNNVLNLAEIAACIVYVGAILIWSFVHSHGGEYDFWGQRTAAIAWRQIPLLPLLAGKNNLITKVTGIGYEKLNVMHRIVGRTSFLLIMLHTLSKIKSFTPDRLVEQKYLTGTLAAVAYGAIFLFSIRPIRNITFEAFLILHMSLVSIYLAGGYYHQKKDTLYVWLFIGFWMLDRLTRVFHLITSNRGKSHSSTALVERISRNAVRLTLPNRKLRWKAGQHVFLTLPTVSTIPFESHPFTIACIPEGKSKVNDLIFYIRAMDGFTRKLDDFAEKHHGERVTALVDGPYGEPPKVNTFSTVILVSGGSGISFTVPLLFDIVAASRRNESVVKRVVFLWCIKTENDIAWATDALIYAQQNSVPGLVIDLQLYITRESNLVKKLAHRASAQSTNENHEMSPTSEKSKDFFKALGTSTDVQEVDPNRSEEKIVPSAAVDSLKLQPKYGRPDIKKILQEEIMASPGPVSINAAGPSPLTKGVRAALRGGAAGPGAILRGGQSVSMYVENFGNFKRQ